MLKSASIVLATILLCLFAGVAVNAETAPAFEKTVHHAIRQDTSPPLAELIELARQQANQLQPQAQNVIREIENHQLPAALQQHIQRVSDGTDLVQREFADEQRSLGLLGTGLAYSNSDNPGLVAPPDTVGDVGGNFYIVYANLGWIILDKNTLTPTAGGGPFAGNTFWAGFGGPCQTNNSGDPIVLYDHFADRWVFSQFTGSGTPNQCFAISTTSNPLGPYHRFQFPFTNFNDYPKLGLWLDASGTRSSYTLSVNEFSGGFVGASLSVFERDVMLDPAALPPPQQDRFFFAVTADDAFFAVSVPSLLGPKPAPAGTCPTFIQMWDDEQFGSMPFLPTDGYQLFEICPDWPGTSTATGPTYMDVGVEYDAELCGFGPCIPQPGTGQLLDVLGQFTMHRTTVRYHLGAGTLNAVVVHTVDVGGDQAGIRWTEIDLLGGPTVIDQGVYAPDGENRWVPSAATDNLGNLGIGYSLGSAAIFPSIRMAGRRPADSASTLKGEITCINGTGAQTGTSRWGDYSSMSVDPADGCTFYYATEYLPATSGAGWVTQVCKFEFAGCIEAAIFCEGFETGDTSAWSFTLGLGLSRL